MKILNISLIVLIIVVTVVMLKVNPQMHNRVVVEPSELDYAPVTQAYMAPSVSDREIPPYQQQNVQVNELPPAQTTKIISGKPNQGQKIIQTITKPIGQKTQVSEKIEQPKKQNELIERVIKNTQEQKVVILPKVETQKPVEQMAQKPQEKVIEKPKPQSQYMTEEEEIIAWNKWRSEFQNAVMKSTDIAAPLGTVFMFSCVVDKYGNISNINTWSKNPNYTPVAKSKVKPVIQSMQNTSQLKFPERTKRNIVTINGSFTIAYTDRFSTPDDYSDYERIKK